ncbi:MAG: response regulator [Marinoscillum sp.]|uniref:response regulator n=1 Tax=Marinoscillum sp. TaxID=2024838 RepID=UPI003304890F
MSRRLLEKQIARIREKYPEEEFFDRLFEKVASSYVDFERVQKLKDRSIRLMSQELHDLYRAQEEKQQAFISTILGKIVDGIITCNKAGKIISVNSSAEHIIGKDESEVRDLELSTILADFETYDEFLSHYYLNLAKNENQIEVSISGKAEAQIPCEVSVSQFEMDEVSTIVILRDITERKKVEAIIIEEKEKAEKASRAKAEFLSTMSHEIRTPMNSIIGMTNILIQDDFDEETMNLLNTLKFSSEHLLVLINDILDFNKIEAGKIEFEHIDFNLKELVENINESHKYRANEKGVQIELAIDPMVPNWVVGDPGRLSQILTNLVGNAVKFTTEGSVITRLTPQQKEGSTIDILFEVIDTGIGIAEGKQKLIFESFSQSETYTTRQYGGTGLGLAITKKLIELQNGHLEVTSTPRIGSNFHFSLQFTLSNTPDDALAKPVAGAYATQDELVGLKILLVEDNPINQFVAGKFLSKWKCDVTIAENGHEAWEKVQADEFDIILMDLQMPGKNGFEATREIRNSDKVYKDIPIIALTATAFLEEKNRALKAGMNDFVTKPFNPKELYEKILKNMTHST